MTDKNKILLDVDPSILEKNLLLKVNFLLPVFLVKLSDYLSMDLEEQSYSLSTLRENTVYISRITQRADLGFNVKGLDMSLEPHSLKMFEISVIKIVLYSNFNTNHNLRLSIQYSFPQVI